MDRGEAQRVEATFAIDRWEEQPAIDAGGATFVRTSIAKTFSGGITGTSVAEMVMAAAGPDDPPTTRAYAGFERITGRVDGRDGSFVLVHDAAMWTGGGRAAWTVLEGSGDGGLTGIAGTAAITRPPDGGHAFTLDYTLPAGG